MNTCEFDNQLRHLATLPSCSEQEIQELIRLNYRIVETNRLPRLIGRGFTRFRVRRDVNGCKTTFAYRRSAILRRHIR